MVIEILGIEINEYLTIDEAVKELNKRGVFGKSLPQLIGKAMKQKLEKKRQIDKYEEYTAQMIIDDTLISMKRGEL